MNLIKIPDRLDEAPQMLLWTMDELLPPIFLFAVGVIFKSPFLYGLVGFAGSYVYRKFRESKPDGYIIHMCYYYGLPLFSEKKMPNPFIRRFFP